MKVIKYFSKPILMVLHLTILTLVLIAFIIPFCKDLFIANETTKQSYEIFLKQPLSYTFQGIISSSNELLENKDANFISSFLNYSDEFITSLKRIKLTVICIFIASSLLVVSQISKYRVYATNITSVLLLALMLILKHQGLTNFEESKLIIESTNALSNVITLLIVAVSISFLQIGFKEFIERKK